MSQFLSWNCQNNDIFMDDTDGQLKLDQVTVY